MGKKRRILTRTTKFAKKYFEFLDKADGADNNIIDTSSGRGDPYIDTVNVVDNEDQTVTVSGRVFGMKAAEKVEISVDGGAFGNEATVNVGGSGIDGVTYTKTIGVGDALSVGSHTFNVRKKDATDESLRKSATADVRENKIGFDISAAVINDTSGNINIDLRTATVSTTGKKSAGEGGAASFQDGSNGFVVTVKDPDGNAVAVKAAATRTKTQAQSAGGRVNGIMNAAANGVFTVTITPRSNTGPGEASLTESAQSVNVTVTGA